jgi:hypothetical protein
MVMKRIINGVTYNTETSTRLASAKWGDDDESVVGDLYQTRGGAFFVDEETTKRVWNEREREWQERVEHAFNPLSQEEAHRWILEGEVEVFHNPFDDPPEAEAEAEPGATIYIRVPAALKRRVDDAARGEKLSGNAWAMKCVEKCLEERSINDFKNLGIIWEIASQFQTMGTEGDWSRETCIEALCMIADRSADLAEQLLGDSEELANIMITQEVEEIRRKFQPFRS